MMIKKVFTLTTGSVDCKGDIILPGAMKLMEGKPLRIFDNFDASKQLGIVTDLKTVGNDCIATGMFNEDPAGLYPAVGFTAIKYHENAHGGRTFDEIDLWCIGITPAPNADPNIKPIS